MSGPRQSTASQLDFGSPAVSRTRGLPRVEQSGIALISDEPTNDELRSAGAEAVSGKRVVTSASATGCSPELLTQPSRFTTSSMQTMPAFQAFVQADRINAALYFA